MPQCQLASYIFFLTLLFAEEPETEKNLKWNCYTLIYFSPINFTKNPGVPVAVYINFIEQCNMRKLMIGTNEKHN